MEGYSAFPKVSTLLEPHHQIVLCHIQDTRCRRLTFLPRYSRCILQPLCSWTRSFPLTVCRRLLAETKQKKHVCLPKDVVKKKEECVPFPVIWKRPNPGLPSLLRLWNTPTASLQRGKTPHPPNEWPGYDTKNLLLRFQYCWSFRECGVPLHCHCSQVHSGREW